MSDDITEEPAPEQSDKSDQRARVRERRVLQSQGIMQAVQALLRPGDLAVDCGANVGAVTEVLAETGADVVAFEPDPMAFAALKIAIAGAANVTVQNAAVGIEAGTTPLFRGAEFDQNPIVETRRSTIMPGANRTAKADVVVEVIDLPKMLADWIADRGEVAFLKLDIEGAELDILTEMLRKKLFDHVRLTVAELHGYKFPTIKEEFVALRRTLSARYPESRVFLDWV